MKQIVHSSVDRRGLSPAVGASSGHEGPRGSIGVTAGATAVPLRVLLVTSNTTFIDRLRAGLAGDSRVALTIGPAPAAKTRISDLLVESDARLVAADADLFDRGVLIPVVPRQVEEHGPDVLLLFEKIGLPTVELCLASHAHGCLEFNASAETFAHAVDAMANGGELWFPRWMMEPFYEMALTTNSGESPHGMSPAHGSAHDNSDLTEREAEVMALAQLGLTNKEIGARLHISPHTAKKHLHNGLIKHGIRRRRQLYR